MSVRRLLAASFTAAVTTFVLAPPASARSTVQAAGTVTGWTVARAWATSAALLGLLGLVIGAAALTRRARGTGLGRRGAPVAVVSGLTAVVVGVLNLVVSDGGPGTGNGVVGGAMAIVFGLVALVLGWRGLVIARRGTGS
ncbi:DUF6223 family protein [Longispora urticae]